MTPSKRKIMDEIPAYVPGRADRGLVKLSSNESPFEPLPGVLARAIDALRSMHRYPDLLASELVTALSAKFALPADWIAVGAGSAAVLQQVVQAVVEPGDEVVYPWRSFEAYPIITRLGGATTVAVPLRPDGGMDLGALADAVTERTKIVVVCSPNNPTGTAVRRADLTAFLDRIPKQVLVLLDEAYVEYVRDPDAVDGMSLLAGQPNLCLLRTFSKAYGLAGLRVGYALAQPEIAEAVTKCAIPFGVSTVAQQAAIESLRGDAEMRARAEIVIAERQRVRQTLLSYGWAVPDSQANFVWLPTGARTDEFAALCRRSGFLVRPYSGEGCRVTIGTPPDNDVFLKTIHEWARGSE